VNHTQYFDSTTGIGVRKRLYIFTIHFLTFFYLEEIHSLRLRMGVVDEENAPELFSTAGDRITKDNKRKVIQVQPLRSFMEPYPTRPDLLYSGRFGLQTAMLLPPNHPHAPERAGSLMKYPYYTNQNPFKD
jgi:hypothetical protein